MYYFLQLIKVFINTNFVVAFSAYCLYKITENIFGFHSPNISAFIFFSTLFAYTYMRQCQYFILNKSNFFFGLSSSLLTKFILVISFCVIFFLVLTLDFKFLKLVSPVILICVLYPITFQFKNLVFNIRSIPYLKIFLIALVWSYMTILVPVLYFSYEINYFVADFFFQRFLFILAIAIPFDIRDISSDNIKTIPNTFGIYHAKMLGFFCLLIVDLLLIIDLINQVITINQFIALFLTIELTSVVLYLSHEKKSFFFYGIIVEGLSIIMCLFVLISDLF